MIKFEEKIIFRPLNTMQVNICNKLGIPFITSIVFGSSFPIFIGDLKDKEKYMKIINEEEEKMKEDNT